MHNWVIKIGLPVLLLSEGDLSRLCENVCQPVELEWVLRTIDGFGEGSSSNPGMFGSSSSRTGSRARTRSAGSEGASSHTGAS